MKKRQKRNSSDGGEWRVGLARVDITPQVPIQMSGYGLRVKPAMGIHDLLFAKAMAIEDKSGARAVIITADLIGIDRDFAEEIFKAVQHQTGLARERLIINYSHTHGGPILGRKYPQSWNLKGAEMEAVENYTETLGHNFVSLVAAALADLRPSGLSYQLHNGLSWQSGAGTASFAMNRRRFTPAGVTNAPYPRGYVDRSVPVLRIDAPNGKLRGVLFGYSCHNTTLGGDNLLISADYAGYAQRYIEKQHPDIQAMFMQGCGADANPWPRGTFALARKYGETLGAEVGRVLETEFNPLHGPLRIAFDHVNLPLDHKPSAGDLSIMRRQGPYYAEIADKIKILIDSGKPWAKYYRTPLAVWQFGRDLTLVRLSGEVVSDYILLLERELGPLNLWVAGYCDDYFGYLPSARVHREGGYEARDFISGYGFLAASVERVLLRKVRALAAQAGRTKIKQNMWSI